MVGAKGLVTDLPKCLGAVARLLSHGGAPAVHLEQSHGSDESDNDGFRGEIEEYWERPDKWKRTVKMVTFTNADL